MATKREVDKSKTPATTKAAGEKPTTVVCGTSKHNGKPFVGLSVKKIRELAQEMLNIPEKANTLIDGKRVTATRVLKAGEMLEFVKPAGRHG